MMAGFLEEDADFDATRRIYLLVFISLIGIVTLIPMGVMAFHQGYTGLGIVDLVLAVLLTANLVHARYCARYCKKHNIYNIYFGITCTALLYIYAFLTGGVNQSGFVWYFTFPLIACFLMGAKRGAAATLMILAPAIVLFLLQDPPPFLAVYNNDFKFRFIPSFLVVTAFTFLFEHSREKSRKELRQAHQELEDRVEERTAQLSETNVELTKEIAERKALEEQLIEDALHDSLTRLPNRNLFLDRLKVAMSRARRRRGYLFAVLFLDIDRFKNVNDSLGHLMGDQLLVSIADRLEKALHSDDTVARLGGDEFAILLDDIQACSNATSVANRIRDSLSLHFSLSDHEVFVTASIGIAFGDRKYRRPEELLRDADTAMYHAKTMGRDCHAVFDRSMHTKAVAFLRMENDLRRAMEKEELSLYYQPIVELKTGRIAGLEALARWRHPERGLIPPGEFIPVAEETGLIIPIGRWVLREACRKMKSWHEQFPQDPPLTISVNLSAKEFTPDLVKEVKRTLRETGFRADCLRLEITESALMKDAKAAASILEELRALKVRLYMDDFGTGYSSLSYLHQLPIDALKIDRSFISKMLVGDENTEIVGAILGMAESLRIDVVAEGIEKQEQLEYLRRQNCRYAQGYLLSRPLAEKDVSPLIQGNLDAVPEPPAGEDAEPSTIGTLIAISEKSDRKKSGKPEIEEPHPGH
jgi:diguanylate cyclase (GGDEF)-like protein